MKILTPKEFAELPKTVRIKSMDVLDYFYSNPGDTKSLEKELKEFEGLLIVANYNKIRVSSLYTTKINIDNIITHLVIRGFAFNSNALRELAKKYNKLVNSNDKFEYKLS